MDFKFLPYTVIDGIPSMSNSYIKGIYDRCVESGLEEILFHDGSINDADDFMNHVTNLGTMFWAIFYRKKMVGFFWLNRLEKTHAYCHFAAFPEIWGRGLAEEAGKQAMTIALKHFSMIIGMIPADNQVAIDYLGRVGLTDLADVPNLLWSKKLECPITGKLMCITREDLHEDL